MRGGGARRERKAERDGRAEAPPGGGFGGRGGATVQYIRGGFAKLGLFCGLTLGAGCYTTLA